MVVAPLAEDCDFLGGWRVIFDDLPPYSIVWILKGIFDKKIEAI